MMRYIAHVFSNLLMDIRCSYSIWFQRHFSGIK